MTCDVFSERERAELESMAPQKLIGSSSDPPTVLSQSQMQQLRRALPPRHSLSDWSLLYSTEQHGCSLRTFYSRLEAQVRLRGYHERVRTVWVHSCADQPSAQEFAQQAWR